MHDQLTEEELASLSELMDLEKAAAIAVTCIGRLYELGGNVVQLCGPMSTGGRGHIDLNMARFRIAMEVMHEHGVQVFNQMVFQDMMIRITGFRPGMPVEEYNVQILEGFYGPVFHSGLITTAIFLPDWESSHGASWERELLKKLGVEILEYPTSWFAEVQRREALIT
ncbi:MAG: hypothetical protein AAB582_00100 [Patescibacteria group bacterium]